MYNLLLRLGFSSEALNNFSYNLSRGSSRNFEAYVQHMRRILTQGTIDTIYMVFLSAFFAIILGTAIGLFLFITPKGGVFPMPPLNRAVGIIVNIGRSIPFVVLIILAFPLSRHIVGTSIGRTAAIVPLTIAAVPFLSRVVEATLLELGSGIIEAAISSGANIRQIIYRVILPESAPGLVAGFTLLVINLITFSAMAGVVGSGGLGHLANSYGLQRSRTDVLIYTVIILVIIVQIVQAIGQFISRKLDKR
jgi:D-methionine transport system permease protein